MTLDQFFVKLKRTRRTWFTDVNGDIRNARGYCPLCAVSGGRSKIDYWAAGKRLRLTPHMATKIARSADAGLFTPSRYRKLRGRILVACGLTEGS